MSFFENTRKPVGLGGKIMVAMMNLGHSPVARWGLRFLELAPDARVLDCGCGGGANIKRLLKKCPQGIVRGVDYSAVSVEKARNLNRTAIQKGRCAVWQSSVEHIIFEKDWFDAVTAFETVYFWSDLPRCLREVRRVLKPGGTFLICNESNGDTDKDEKWTEIIGGMTIHKDIELKAYLEQAVHRSRDDYGSDELVRMKAPATAFQGEIVSFKGYGPSKEWRWQFGESGIVDSREQNPLYAYTEPGIYEVLLTTENTQYPVRHTIEILPQYTENDSTDVLVIIGNDIREHLQAIVDGKPFNTHYNYILKKYLCGNPDIAVTVNNSKKNDFYSYCQGLKIIARRKTLIDEVFVDMGDNLNNECVMQLMVTQHERFSEQKNK